VSTEFLVVTARAKKIESEERRRGGRETGQLETGEAFSFCLTFHKRFSIADLAKLYLC
jgi:hypothetical protein